MVARNSINPPPCITGYLSTTPLKNEGICTVYYNNVPKLDHVYTCVFSTEAQYDLHTVKIPSYL